MVTSLNFKTRLAKPRTTPQKKDLLKLLGVSSFFVSFCSIATYLEARTGLPVSNTFLLWIIYAFVLYTLVLTKKRLRKQIDEKQTTVINWYLIWIVINIARGFFEAENYWDWKALATNGMAQLLPLVAFITVHPSSISTMLRFYCKYTLPLFVVFAFFISTTAYGFYLVPIGMLLFFLPVLPQKWKVVSIVTTLVVFLADLDARSNVIKFVVPLLFLSVYYTRRFVPVWLIEIIRKTFFLLPVVFFAFAITGVFNIFQISEYIQGSYEGTRVDAKGEVQATNLTADTRTFLYVEVLSTADKYNTWLFGRSIARGNESEWFANISEITGKAERYANEVAILNIFTWMGLVGVVLYMLIFYKASYLAINHSRNIFSKMIGLFVSFRWTYAWVEDLNNFSLNFFFLWVLIGFCFSPVFRNMSNKEMTTWIRNTLSTKKVRKIKYKEMIRN